MNVLFQSLRGAALLSILALPSEAVTLKDWPVCSTIEAARELYPVWMENPDAARAFLIEDAESDDPLFPHCVVPKRSATNIFAAREVQVFMNGLSVHFPAASYEENGSTYYGYTFVILENLSDET